ncbi:MAG: ribosome recycling factor [Hyphomicrobiaceae bacterium]
MTAQTFDAKDIERRMQGAIAALKHDLNGLRTGRANPNLLDPLTVDAYGQKMPISQLGTVTVPEPRMISLQVWDRSMLQAVERAIRDSSLGINPVVDGQIIRLRMPELTEDRRKDLVKIAHKYAEQARIAVRNVRRDGMELLKKLEKDHKIGEDEHRKHSTKVQELTDKTIKDIDGTLVAKEAEIMQV